jgi:hypothetical protein
MIWRSRRLRLGAGGAVERVRAAFRRGVTGSFLLRVEVVGVVAP